MGCGKKLVEEVRFTMTMFGSCLILETVAGIVSACLGWYCFFYWIEKEVRGRLDLTIQYSAQYRSIHVFNCIAYCR